MVVMSPKDENELQRMVLTSIEYDGPAAVRFPRGSGEGVPMDDEVEPLPIGKAEILREGEDVALIALGPMVGLAMGSAEQLAELHHRRGGAEPQIRETDGRRKNR